MEGTYYQLNEASISPRPIQRPMPLWVGGSAKQAIERTARWGTGWQAGIDSADQVGPIIEGIKTRTAELGRKIDEDHYGAGFGFRFGTFDEPIIQRYNELLTKRLGRDPKGFTAIGGTDEIMSLISDFRKAGVHKFILRPIASGTTDMMAQTERLIEEVLPEVRALNR